jgi:hypothetical protein
MNVDQGQQCVKAHKSWVCLEAFSKGIGGIYVVEVEKSRCSDRKVIRRPWRTPSADGLAPALPTLSRRGWGLLPLITSAKKSSNDPGH